MTHKLNPKRITQLLTQGTWQMDNSILSELSNAREKALQRQSARAPVFALATGRWANLFSPLTNYQWISAALLAAMLVVGMGYWHHVQEQQIADLDAAILTDDLPIEVFVD